MTNQFIREMELGKAIRKFVEEEWKRTHTNYHELTESGIKDDKIKDNYNKFELK